MKITLTTTPTIHVRDGTSWQRRIRYIFCFNFWKAQVLFVEPLIPLFRISGDILSGFLRHVTRTLRFTSGVTPADLLAASMAADPFSSMYLRAGIG